MKTSSICLLSAAAALLACYGTPVAAATKQVNCDRGQSLRSAIDKAHGTAGPIEIFVKGTCEEDIAIGRDYVIIDGAGEATIVGRVRISEARGVRLRNLTVTGPRDGVLVSLGGSVLLQSVNLVDNDSNGLRLRRQSFARLNNCVVEGNGADGVAIEQSTLDAQSSSFSGNDQRGIEADVGSSAIVRESELSGNSGGGVSLSLHSVAEIRDESLIIGNGAYGAHLAADSGLRLGPGVEFFDSIDCDDQESSFADEGAVLTGPVACSTFDE